MIQPVAPVLHGQGDDAHADGQEEDLEEQPETVDDDQAAVQLHRTRRPHHQCDHHDGDQAHHRQASQPFFPALRQEQVHREHQEGQRREDELRRQQVQVGGVVDGHSDIRLETPTSAPSTPVLMTRSSGAGQTRLRQ